jgi:hypothetical protein
MSASNVVKRSKFPTNMKNETNREEIQSVRQLGDDVRERILKFPLVFVNAVIRDDNGSLMTWIVYYRKQTDSLDYINHPKLPIHKLYIREAKMAVL